MIEKINKKNIYNCVMSKLTPEESINLKKLICDYNAEDNTGHIRKIKHSMKIRQDISIIETLKREYKNLRLKSGLEFLLLAQEKASFLYMNYTDIFNRLLKDELDLEIMNKFLIILKMIEDERCNQHEGSVAIGKLLKELYLDSAIKKSNHLDKEMDGQSPEDKREDGRSIHWNQWRKKRGEIMENLKQVDVSTSSAPDNQE